MSRKLNFVLPLLVLLLCSAGLRAQKQGQALMDSLQQALAQGGYKNAPDTGKVLVLDRLSAGYAYIDPGQGIRYGQDALALARKIGWQGGIARACASIGGNYENMSDYPNAFRYEFAALDIYEHVRDMQGISTMYINLGIVYRNHDERDKAHEYFNKALKAKREMNDLEGVALAYGNLANLSYSMHKYDETLRYDDSALLIQQQRGDKAHEAMILGNIGNAYADSGVFGLAMSYYFRSLRMDTLIGDNSATARDLGNIGETYLEIARDSAGKIKADSLIAEGCAARLAAAIDFLERSVQLCTDIHRAGYLEEYCMSLSEAYAMAGRYRDALQQFRRSVGVRDSVGSLEREKEAARQKLNYEYGKREEELRYDKKITEQRYIAGIAGLALFSLLMYRNFRSQKKLNAIIVKEKKRSEDLLLNILPAQVAEELKETGRSAARQFDNVTVLFTDFVSFTEIAETLSPQALIDELDVCFKAFDEIVTRYGIEKIKTIGDAYLAAAGLPNPDPQHAEHVIKAAMEIAKFVAGRSAILGNSTFRIRIGVHSGSVVAGIVGSKKFAYDIWGDAVNIAARMEQNSDAGRINMSEATYALVQDKFACEYRGEVQVKGKGMMKMYYVPVTA